MRDTEHEVVLAIDLGKTSCRARVSCGDDVLATSRATGAPGLADHDGAALSFNAIDAALSAIDESTRNAITTIGIGAAGVEAGAGAARQLIGLIRDRMPVPVAVVNDALAAHAGAFGGGPGAVLIVGTGAIVYVVTTAGTTMQIDGWGPWLGDGGSGQWIGRHGLQAVLRAHDGRGPATALTQDAIELAGSIPRLPQWVSETGAPARQLGTFAPTVIARAAAGDLVAETIVTEATRLLAATCAAAGVERVCVIGGVAEHPHFAAKLTSALAGAGMREQTPLGDALAGSTLIALAADLPYEERIIRG